MTVDAAARVEARCREVAARRRELDPATVAGASAAVADRVIEIARSLPPGRAASYFPVDGEIDPAAATDALRALGWTTWFPAPAPEATSAMTFRRWDGPALPPPGRFGLPTPPPGGVEAEASSMVLVLVPLVLFGPAGARAGRGGGYYDRTFVRLRSGTTDERPVLVGLAHDFQEDGVLVSRPRDVPLDVTVTPTRALRW